MTPGGVRVSPVVNFELARLAEHQRLKIHETLATSPELRQHQESLPVSRDRAECARGRRRTPTCPGRLQGEEGETSESWCSVRSGGGVERKQNLGRWHVGEGTSEGVYIVCRCTVVQRNPHLQLLWELVTKINIFLNAWGPGRDAEFFTEGSIYVDTETERVDSGTTRWGPGDA